MDTEMLRAESPQLEGDAVKPDQECADATFTTAGHPEVHDVDSCEEEHNESSITGVAVTDISLSTIHDESTSRIIDEPEGSLFSGDDKIADDDTFFSQDDAEFDAKSAQSHEYSDDEEQQREHSMIIKNTDNSIDIIITNGGRPFLSESQLFIAVQKADEELTSMELPHHNHNQPRPSGVLRAPDAGITDNVLARLCEMLAKHRIQMREIALRANRITDIGAASLADLISTQKLAVETIDLTQNGLSAVGVLRLVLAFNQHPGNLYPRQGPQGISPAVLLVERNYVRGSGLVLSALRTATVENPRGPVQGPNAAAVQPVILPRFSSQRRPKRGGPGASVEVEAAKQLLREARRRGFIPKTSPVPSRNAVIGPPPDNNKPRYPAIEEILEGKIEAKSGGKKAAAKEKLKKKKAAAIREPTSPVTQFEFGTPTTTGSARKTDCFSPSIPSPSLGKMPGSPEPPLSAAAELAARAAFLAKRSEELQKLKNRFPEMESVPEYPPSPYYPGMEAGYYPSPEMGYQPAGFYPNYGAAAEYMRAAAANPYMHGMYPTKPLDEFPFMCPPPGMDPTAMYPGYNPYAGPPGMDATSARVPPGLEHLARRDGSAPRSSSSKGLNPHAQSFPNPADKN